MTDSPLFALTDLHIRDLGGLRALDLPRDGLGWQDGFPPVSMVAGANGSGKTTLLNAIASAAKVLAEKLDSLPLEVVPSECRMDFRLGDGKASPLGLRFLVGDEAFWDEHAAEHCFGYVLRGERGRAVARTHGQGVEELRRTLGKRKAFLDSLWPRLVFLPSEDRDLVVPDVAYKAPGKLEDQAGFVVAWQRLGPKAWRGSTLELLFAARWADLNAKEQGQPEAAGNFARFTHAFSELTGGTKALEWTLDGDLVVRLDSGSTHGLERLSSGERQALLLLAELRRLWRPGSLILIDELELHLHDAWQGKLLDVVCSMQAELGGQVIITTQSHSMFEMADLGTRVLLGREGLR